MAKAELKYGKLANGRIDYTFRVTAGADTYAAGDILETADGLTYAKATTIDIAKHYVVCAEDVTLSGSGEIVVYRGGYFNRNIVMVNGAEASDNDVAILKTQNIIIDAVAEQ